MTNPSPESVSDKTTFPETADIETSSDEYAGRFAGETGKWMLDVQLRIAARFLNADTSIKTILDVGGGHGQLAVPLTKRGYAFTVLGSHESCAKRLRPAIDSGRCTFQVGNVIQQPFPDHSFDAVLCFRLLTHCERWPKLIGELCRLTRGPVIADYPTSYSLNAIAPMLFGAKKRIERNTRHWRLFKHREIRDTFAAHGFKIVRNDGQFFLPMVLHRTLKSRTLSAACERVFAAIGWTALFGSPRVFEARQRTPEDN